MPSHPDGLPQLGLAPPDLPAAYQAVLDPEQPLPDPLRFLPTGVEFPLGALALLLFPFIAGCLARSSRVN